MLSLHSLHGTIVVVVLQLLHRWPSTHPQVPPSDDREGGMLCPLPVINETQELSEDNIQSSLRGLKCTKPIGMELSGDILVGTNHRKFPGELLQ